MNTSDFDVSALPDPGVLERLANEYLKEVSSSGTFGTAGVVNNEAMTVAPYVPSVAVPAAPAIPGALTHDQLKSLPTSLNAVPSVPAVPAVPAMDLPGGFGFLQDIRSLEAAAKPLVHAATSAVKIVPAAPIGLVDTALPGASLPGFESAIDDVSAPLAPGAVVRSGDIGDPLSYAFLSDVRPLLSFDAVPSLEPFDYVPDVGSSLSYAAAPFDVNAVRRDFPILEEKVNGRQLVWLDNAATTQKPRAVIDRISQFYLHENSNIHRAAHALAARATDAYEGARDRVARFINASSSKDIIFVRGATEGINLLAQAWGRKNIQKDDEIVITWLEHHANIVPWQMLCAEKGARLKVAPVDSDGQVLLDEYEKLLGPKTKLVSIAQVSNALGTIVPVREMVEAAHRYGARVIVDGAQAISHMPVDVQLYDCDFYVFSGHKVFAPTGIGVVYGKPEVLQHMPPWQGGGNMIVDVTFEKTVYHGAPGRFEAGTGSIAPAVGLGAAIDYLTRIGMHNISRYEHDLLVYATDALKQIPGLHLIGTAKNKASVLSFVLDGFKTEEVGAALNLEGIAVRSGHHCAQPILRRFGLESTVRPSLALYNTCEEVDKLVASIWNLKQGRKPGIV